MSLRSVLKVMGIAVATIAFVGCASMSGGPLIDGEGGDPGRLIIKNNRKGDDITAVLMSRCCGYTMGFNRLENREWINYGKQKTFEMSPGCWDVSMGDGVSHQGSTKAYIESGKDYVIDYK
ncbi:hypothetical protein [Pseudobdellovibrio exovorus]|uniref:Lipoprotein n=1 Tax=Pseudobdellovibrio exovorus JSS TaxID=1184267 RepID=M4V857_9BACT|nr:hypothetical protein [Pseudobdellovibrio exovorus]AGH95398.1 hypothetical protein A11Q_1182 [Pseudobdellovibrio exovorus JSS]